MMEFFQFVSTLEINLEMMITQRITNCDIIVSRHEHFRRFLNEETPDRDLLVV